jgi:PKHD-type hydroxylase
MIPYLKHMFYAYPRGVTKKICNEIIRFGEEQILKEAVVYGTGTIPSDEPARSKAYKKLHKTRNSHIAWLNSFWIFKEIRPFSSTANKLCGWNFEYDTVEQFQFTKYSGDKKQHYTWHADDGPIGTNGQSRVDGKYRKLTTGVMLNDGSEYEGGQFEIYNYTTPNNPKIIGTEEIKFQGTVINFPSFMLHRVRPVTKGTRYSLTTWYRGYPFK